MSTPQDTPGTDVATIISDDTLAVFRQMAVVIPATAGEDAYNDILAQIFAATDETELNAPWDTHKAEQLEGHRLRFDSIKRSESDFAGGLGMYLVCKGLDLTSGDKFTLTIGSVSVVAQMAKIYVMEGFPVEARIVVAERPTKAGNRPIHLNVIKLRTDK